MKKSIVILWTGLLISASPLLAQIETASRIDRVEKGLLPAVIVKGEPAWTMQERMQHYKAAGVSIAVIDSFHIAWAKAYGVKDARTLEPVTATSLFQAASISKTVNATAVMLEVQRGKLSLEADVNTYLRSWKLPDNALTAKTKVTLANLLSHTGGTTVHGFPGYEPGAPLPTIQQVLNGTPPANTEPVIVGIEPGKGFRYSGGGITITQLVLTELEGKPYEQTLEDLVLGPIGMISSTFEQPLPKSREAEVAVAHGEDGQPVPGKFHVYPEMAAAGLWTTPTDLAKFAIEHQLSLQGRSNRILLPEFEEKMVTPFISDRYGLGFGVEKKGKAEYFTHGGGNFGYTCLLIAHKRRGYGAVVMLNSNAYGIIPEIMRSIAREYSWEDYLPASVEAVTLDPDKLQRVTGRYLLSRDEIILVNEEKGKLFASATLAPPTEILAVSDTEFITRDLGRRALFVEGSDRDLDALKLFGDMSVFIAPRLRDDQLTPWECLDQGKVPDAVRKYKEIQKADPSDPSVAEVRLNQIGYQLLGSDKIDAAVAVFTLNVEFHPKSWNAYDSLGEAFAKKGDKASAIRNYEEALRLNPDADGAKKALQRLRM